MIEEAVIRPGRKLPQTVSSIRCVAMRGPTVAVWEKSNPAGMLAASGRQNDRYISVCGMASKMSRPTVLSARLEAGSRREWRMSEARARLLSTASELFYSEGLHSVGIDRIIAAAGVTRATLYRHFPSKDDLVVAYLTQADEAIRTRVHAARTQGASPDDIVRTVGRSIADDIQSPGFRGCAFLNAAAEYPDPTHPVHQAVLRHRQWFLATMAELFSETGNPIQNLPPGTSSCCEMALWPPAG
jgi:AcrR family transcriptional regulator